MTTRLFLLAFWAAVAFATIMALLPAPPGLPVEVSDKVMHMVAFFTLAVLAAGAYPQVALIRIGLALGAFGAAIELAQLIPMLNRYGDVMDWLADMAAIAAALLLVALWRKWSGGVTREP
jgi:hypothetical protein